MEKLPDPLLARLSEFVTARMGLKFPQEKWRELDRNMKPLAAEFGFSNAVDCVEWLLSSRLTRPQMETLASHLTVGETYFFREKQVFEILEERIVPEWIASRRNTEPRLRIWSAGCCSGEEPYSIAMFLSKAIPDWKNWKISILATDINPRFLRKASRGIYNEWSFRDTPSWAKHGCFKKLKDNYEILPRFKEMVTLGYLNLAEDNYPSLLNNTNAMDLIFCRNVLMYFSEEQARKVIGRFHSSLAEGGSLVVSATETSPVLYRQFTQINSGGFTIYKKEQRKTASPEPVHHEKNNFVPAQFFPAASVPTVASEIPEPAENRKPSENEKQSKPAIYEEARALYESGHYTEATEKLLGAASEIIAGAKAAVLMSRAYANQGKLNESLGWCDRAIAAEKMNPELHYLRAIILQEQGNMDAAVTALKRALYLDPEFVLAHFALGNLALRREEFQTADKQFENALSLLEHSSPETVLPGSEGLTSARLSEIIRATMLQEKAA